jgi:hypothetical protein
MKPGSKRLVIGAVMAIGACGTFFITLSSLVRGVSLDPLSATPGTFETRTEESGRYYLWDNHLTMFDGRKVQNSSDFPDDIQISIREKDGKQLVFIRDDGHGWRIGNHAKSSVGYVDSLKPSDIVVQTQGGSEERVLSFAKAKEGQEVWRKLRGFAFAAIAFVLGLPIVFWGLMVRSRASDRYRAA